MLINGWIAGKESIFKLLLWYFQSKDLQISGFDESLMVKQRATVFNYYKYIVYMTLLSWYWLILALKQANKKLKPRKKSFLHIRDAAQG